MSDIVERVRAMVVEAIMEDLAVMVDRMLEEALTPELEVIASQLVTRELQRLRVAMGTADPVAPRRTGETTADDLKASTPALAPSDEDLEAQPRIGSLIQTFDELRKLVDSHEDFIGLRESFSEPILATAARVVRILRGHPNAVIDDRELRKRVGVDEISGIGGYLWQDVVWELLRRVPGIEPISGPRGGGPRAWTCTDNDEGDTQAPSITEVDPRGHPAGDDAGDVDDDEELGSDEDDECELEPTHSEKSLTINERAKMLQARGFIQRRGRVDTKELRAHITVSNLTWGKIRPFLEVTPGIRIERTGNVVTYVWEGRR